MKFTDLSSIPFSLPRNRTQCKTFGSYYRNLWWSVDNEQSYINNKLSLLNNDFADISNQKSQLENQISHEQSNIDNQKQHISDLQTQLNVLKAASPPDQNAIDAKQTELDNAKLILQGMQNDLLKFQDQLYGVTATYNRINSQITAYTALVSERANFKKLLETELSNIEMILRFLTANDLEAMNNPDDVERTLRFNDNLLTQLQLSSTSALTDMVSALKANKYDITNPYVASKIDRCFSIEEQQQAANQLYLDIKNNVRPTTIDFDIYIQNITGDPPQ